MGCSQSTVVAPAASRGKKHDTVATKCSSESSSDDDSAAQEMDFRGRVASDADIISAQRGEKTDVSPHLEDRWLRSHFPTVNATTSADLRNFRGLKRKLKEAGKLSTSDKIVGESDKLTSVVDIKVKARETVSLESHKHCALPTHAPQRLSILHFNDVYELMERKVEPVGGAARFATLFESVAAEAKLACGGCKPLVLFGGDCLNPSILSSATKGAHMVDVLNLLKVEAAVFGNHEFDFGIDHAIACTKKMNFPWFLSNVTENFNEEPLGDGIVSRIIEWNGLKIGIMGLIEEEWLDTLTTVDKRELTFEDYVTRGSELARQLRKDGADLVIALTHMRWPNDIRLAREVAGIDLILGGHDHDYGIKKVGDCVIVKSGCDFRTFSLVDLYLKQGEEVIVEITKYDVTSKEPPNEQMGCLVDKYMTVLEKQLQQPIGEIKIPLDGLYENVRSRETNLGNFVADIMRTTTRADIALINAGTFRSNALHEDKVFRVRDLMRILPIHDNVVVLEVTGKQLLAGLENAVSKYPKYEGRFAQVSGFYFGFNPNSPPGNRVVQESICINGEPLDLKKNYKMATKAYVARGRDGYQCFNECRLFNDPDSGPVVSTVVRNHISNVNQLLQHKSKDELRVVEGGKRIIFRDGSPHRVIPSSPKDAPVFRLQQSMTQLTPTLDINGNRIRRNSELSRKRDFVDNVDEALRDGRTMHMQHLIEIGRDPLFSGSTETNGRFEEARKQAIDAGMPNAERNAELLDERQTSHEDVRWQVLPLVEGRVFHCSKT